LTPIRGRVSEVDSSGQDFHAEESQGSRLAGGKEAPQRRFFAADGRPGSILQHQRFTSRAPALGTSIVSGLRCLTFLLSYSSNETQALGRHVPQDSGTAENIQRRKHNHPA